MKASILLALLALLLSPQTARSEETAAEPEAAATAPAATAGYDGGFFIQSEDGDHSLKIQGRVQARLATEIVEGADPEAAFSISRARLTLKSKNWDGLVSSKLQIDFGKGFVSLKDAVVDFRASNNLKISVGQYKKPFSRQQIVSSSKQAFVDRAITDKAFGAGRDIGVTLHNGYTDSPTFEWAAGLFNGSGDKPHFSGDVTVDPTTGEGSVSGGKFNNVPSLFDPTLVLRAGYNHGKLKGYSEVDLEGGPLRFGVAASLVTQMGSPDGDFLHRQSIDVIVKVSGFSVNGELFFAQDATSTTFGELGHAALGARLQAGYVFDGQYHVGARWAVVDPAEADNAQQEILLVLSDFIKGHGLKLQVDGGALLAADGSADLLVRAQVDVSF